MRDEKQDAASLIIAVAKCHGQGEHDFYTVLKFPEISPPHPAVAFAVPAEVTRCRKCGLKLTE